MTARKPAIDSAAQWRPALLISFSGIDGAGKSTQIANLCAHLREAGLPVRIITFWDDVATLTSLREGAGHKIFKGDRGVGSPEAPIERRDKNVRSPFMTVVRLGLYVLDAVSLRFAARRARAAHTGVVIFDRYLYDELANLDLRRRAVRLYLRLLMRLIPRPDVRFVLDADPEQARARKPEYPLAFLRENRDAYLRLSQTLGGFTVVPPLPVDLAKAEVVGAVLRCVQMRAAERGIAVGPPDAGPVDPQMQMDEPDARPLAS